jgi:hypothetical protein
LKREGTLKDLKLLQLPKLLNCLHVNNIILTIRR